MKPIQSLTSNGSQHLTTPLPARSVFWSLQNYKMDGKISEHFLKFGHSFFFSCSRWQMETIIKEEVKNSTNILGERMHFVPVWTQSLKRLQTEMSLLKTPLIISVPCTCKLRAGSWQALAAKQGFKFTRNLVSSQLGCILSQTQMSSSQIPGELESLRVFSYDYTRTCCF